MVMGYCKAQALDPLHKPVHIVPMRVKNAHGDYEWRDVIMPGVGLYRIRAARTGEFAEKMNKMRKLVVSSTLKNPPWENTQVISSDIPAELSKLREAPGSGDILLAGSARLVQELLNNGLVDELRLMIFPIVLGDGKRLFNAPLDSSSYRLVESRPVGGGVLTVVYQPQKSQ